MCDTRPFEMNDFNTTEFRALKNVSVAEPFPGPPLQHNLTRTLHARFASLAATLPPQAEESFFQKYRPPLPGSWAAMRYPEVMLDDRYYKYDIGTKGSICNCDENTAGCLTDGFKYACPRPIWAKTRSDCVSVTCDEYGEVENLDVKVVVKETSDSEDGFAKYSKVKKGVFKMRR